MKQTRLLTAVALAAILVILGALLLSRRPTAHEPQHGKADAAAIAQSVAPPGGGPTREAPARIVSSATPAAEHGAISGIVVATDRQPVAGARVSLWSLRRGAYSRASGYPTELSQTTTDESGRFTLKGASPQGTAGLLALRVESDAAAAQAITLPKLPASLTFTPRAAGAASGSVVDQEGRPVAGAFIGDFVASDRQAAFANDPAPSPSVYTETGADGAFVLNGIDQQITAQYAVHAPGFVPVLSPPITGGDSDVKILLRRREAGLRGRVTTFDGAAAAGAEVQVRLVGPEPVTLSVTTGDDGEYSFPDLSASVYTLTAALHAEGDFGIGCQATRDIRLQKGEDSDVEIRLPGACRIAGRFAAREGGSAARGVVLKNPFPPAEVTSDREGRFAINVYADWEAMRAAGDAATASPRFELALPAPWLPIAEAGEGQAWQLVSGGLVFSGLKEGGALEVEIPLQVGVTLRGLVVDADGVTPVGTAPVYLTHERERQILSTATDGRFEAVMAAGTEYDVAVATDAGVATERIASRTDLTKTFRLGAWCRIAGLVKTGDGNPVENVGVSLRSDVAENLGYATDGGRSVSNNKGEYALERLLPGVYTMEAVATSGPAAPMKPLTVTLEPGQQLTAFDLVVGEGDVIEGLATDIDGRPLEGVSIMASAAPDTGYLSDSATSDAAGRFTLKGIPVDQAINTVRAKKSGYAEVVRRFVSVYDGELKIQMAPLGTLRIRVVDEASKPIPDYEIQLRRPAPRGGWEAGPVEAPALVAAADGVYTKAELEPGTYRADVRQRDESGREHSGFLEFEHLPGNSPERLLTLAAGAPVTGRVVDATSGAPVADAVVSDESNPFGDAREALTATTDADGRFTLGPLAPGSHTLKAAAQGRMAATQPVQVSASGTPEVTISLPAGATLTATLRGKDGSATAGEILIAPGTGGPGNVAQAVPSTGTLTFPLPEPGTMTVTARAGDAAQAKELTVEAGGVYTLDFDFSKLVTLKGRVFLTNASGRIEVTLRGIAGGSVPLRLSEGSGAFSEELAPGDYVVLAHVGELLAPVGDPITVRATPSEQARDIDVALAPFDLVIENAESLPEGATLRLLKRVGSTDWEVLAGWPAARASTRFPALPAGAYRAVIDAPSGPVAQSDWTAIAPERENHLSLSVPSVSAGN